MKIQFYLTAIEINLIKKRGRITIIIDNIKTEWYQVHERSMQENTICHSIDKTATLLVIGFFSQFSLSRCDPHFSLSTIASILFQSK